VTDGYQGAAARQKRRSVRAPGEWVVEEGRHREREREREREAVQLEPPPSPPFSTISTSSCDHTHTHPRGTVAVG
jgi:hypothetical protein